MKIESVPGKIQRFAALPARGQWTLLRVAATVAFVRIALWVLPFRWVCSFVCNLPVATDVRDGVSVSALEWSVSVVSRRIPLASCLTQALALRWLLVRAGHPASLRIGVAKDGARGFAAHAWVESRGQILLGSEGETIGFAPILALPPPQA